MDGWGPGAHLAAVCVVLAVSIALPVVLRVRRGWSMSPLAWGGTLWAASVALKVMLALVLFRGVAWLASAPWWAIAPITGLLTGATEVGLSVLLLRVVPIVRGSYAGGAMFGLGFGVFEAIVLSLLTALRVVVAGIGSSLLESADADVARRAVANASEALTFVHERLISLPVHTLAGAWIVLGLAEGRWRVIVGAAALKSVIDAVPAERLPQAWLQALYFAVGAISACLLWRLDRRYQKDGTIPTALIPMNGTISPPAP